MSQATEVEDVYSAIEESAQRVGAPCSREKIVPILTAYGDALADAGIVLSVSTGEHPPAELDYTITVPTQGPDPYATAVEHGFVARTDHPAATLLSDIREQVPVSEYFIDGGVVAGFSKIYAHFPFDPLTVERLAALPSMPRAVAENADLFARYGLDKVQMISMDYKKRQVNLYFNDLKRQYLEPASVVAMATELGLHVPSELGLEFCKGAFAVYPTLSWDTGKIERLCFAVISTDPNLVPSTDERDVELFRNYATKAPYSYVGEQRTLVYGITLSPHEEYYKLGAYYHITDVQRQLVKAFEALKD